MALNLPYRPPTNGTSSSSASNSNRRTSFSSFPPSHSASSASSRAPIFPQPLPAPLTRNSDNSSQTPSTSSPHSSLSASQQPRSRYRRFPKVRSQYPPGGSENHVEYILVASFHVDRGPIMEHQYPGAISGDEHMLAELMLPDQAHVRNQDWTIFFLHKDTGAEEDDEGAGEPKEKKRRKKKRKSEAGTGNGEEEDGSKELGDGSEDNDEAIEEEEEEEELEGGEGPPLIYVLNLVNTKQDSTVKRGAVVRAMAICTRHSFLHIYKPLLLLALEEYFKEPYSSTLASLYDAVNSMDLSLMPRLSVLERHILQSSDTKDLFVEKFEYLIRKRMAEEAELPTNSSSPDSPSKSTTDLTRSISHPYPLPRDTHEFECRVLYNKIPIPIKVPVAISPETVGDFSLIKLIQSFSVPHSISPQPFMLHPHLTTAGAYTHPIIVLVNAMLTQKRVIFLGHNRPSGEVAEAVLAACALASGGVLRGFTRHAFPYTDLTKIDDLLKVPGFIAGVTNPAFANHPEWWDLLCDIPTGRMKISNRIEPAPVTEGQIHFQQQNPMYANGVSGGQAGAGLDPTGDQSFMDDVLKSINSRYGEGVIRAKWKDWVVKFTRISAAFEESVYGISALYIGGEEADAGAAGVSGHGYVWGDEAMRQKELAGNVSRIEGWRNTRSYYSFIQDLAQLYTSRPISRLDLHHHHDRLRTQKLSHNDSAAIYLAFSSSIHSYKEICQLLTVTPESHAGLFYLSLGLFHPQPEVRTAAVVLLERIQEHEAGRHFWSQLGRFAKLAFCRVKREDGANGVMNEETKEQGIGIDGRMRASMISRGTRSGASANYLGDTALLLSFRSAGIDLAHLKNITPTVVTMIRQDYGRIDAKRRATVDHRKKQFATSSYEQLKYENRLNFYELPPTEEITLEEFETWAIDRLRILAELEACSFRNKTPTETAAHITPLLQKYLPLRPNTSSASSFTDPSLRKERQKDHYSHFILRLAFSGTDDLRRRFARVETALFRLRFQADDASERKAFVKSLNFDWDFVTEDEKRELEAELKAATPGLKRIEEEEYFKVDWERVPELVEGRRVLLKRGKAYVPVSQQSSMVVAEFTAWLDKGLELTSRALPRLDENDRLTPILHHLSKNFATPDSSFSDSEPHLPGAAIDASSIDTLSTHFPLCMKNLHLTLRAKNHLKHYGRLQYTLFLKGMGLTMEDCLIFWRQSFKAVTDDTFNKEYRYNIRHAYGDVGGDANRRGRGYSPYSCQKILTEHPPGPGEAHGCPYRHFSTDNLTSLLQATGVSDRDVLRGVKEDVEKKRFHIACNRVFEHAHKTEIKKVKEEGTWGAAELDTIVHPNTYFKRSYLLKNLGKDGDVQMEM